MESEIYFFFQVFENLMSMVSVVSFYNVIWNTSSSSYIFICDIFSLTMEYCKDLPYTFTYHPFFQTDRWKVITALILLLLTQGSQAQTLRGFPPLFNVAKDRPLSGSPTLNTCGEQDRSAFCKSSTLPASVDSDCRQDFCVQDCPFRSSLPAELSLTFASGFGVCVNSDTVNVRPGSRPGDYSAVFSSGSQCFITPVNIPSLGSNGAITLSFWIWQDANNLGWVLFFSPFSCTHAICHSL